MTKLQITFYFRVFFLVMIIVSSGHFLGCIWLMLGRFNVLQIQNPCGWMVSAYAQDDEFGMFSINNTKDFVSVSISITSGRR